MATSDSNLRQRLLAILAADVSGFSRLMSLDERATVAALDAARAVFRTQIEAHQGRVIDMAGDSVLAVFETASGAVAAALTAQAQLNPLSEAVPEDRRMRFRIGVHLGDVIEKPDGTVYGDGVNIAARLEGLAEPGGITVSESIRVAVKGKVAARFEDQGEQSVKNIAEPVRTYRVTSAAGSATVPSTSPTVTAPLPAAGAIDLSLPDKPSIAVLPFTNMSSDAEQEYFSDGVTEDIITELSRFHSLFVIARNSSFTYKGRPADIKQVGRELGVRYVLEGSIRKSASRIRVTAQLIDALMGHHVWAEKYDRVLEDIFAVQEELTLSIIGAVAPAIQASELSKARVRPANLTAYEMALRANANVAEAQRSADWTLLTSGIAEAREALAIDANCAGALNAIAYASWLQLFSRIAIDRSAALQEGLAAAERLVAVAPANALGHRGKAQLLLEKGAVDEALWSVRQAHSLNPNDTRILHVLALAELCAGEAQQAISHLRQALRINPRDPSRWGSFSLLGVANFFAKEYALALEASLVAAAEAPNLFQAQIIQAAAYIGLDDIDKGKATLDSARRLAPAFVESRLRGEMPYRNPEQRQRYITFLRIAAGLEDPSAAAGLR